MKKYGLAAFLFLSIVQVCESQPVGDCGHGDADALLDVNNVRAAVYNNGNLFWRGRGNTYTVPKSGTANAIFVSQFWVGGMVGGALRGTAGS